MLSKYIKKNGIWHLVSIFWFLSSISFSIIFFAINGLTFLDSDMSSEMVLASLQNRDHSGLFYSNWYYSTDVRVGYLQIFFRIGLLLFPHNWSMARLFAVSLLLIILACSYIYFAYSINMKKGAFWIAGALMLPFSSFYAYFILFGNSYLPHIIVFMLTLGLFFRITKTKDRPYHTILLLLILGILTLISSMNGVRMAMNLYVPFILAIGIVMFIQIMSLHTKDELKNMLKSRVLQRTIIASIVIIICTALGYLINSKILLNKFELTTFTSEMVLTDFSVTKLMDCIAWFFSLFGWQVGGYAARTPIFTSMRGMVSFLGLLIGAAILFSSIRLFFHWKKMSIYQKILLVLFWCILLIDGSVFAFTEFTGYGVHSKAYYIPAMPIGFIMLHMEGCLEKFSFNFIPRMIALGFAGCIAATSCVTAKHYIEETPVIIEMSLYDTTQWLVENGYTDGFATFWLSNLVTEWSDGELEMWTVYDIETLTLQKWLQEKQHFNRTPEGKVFVLLIGDETVSYEKIDGASTIYQSSDNLIRVIGFDSVAEIYSHMEK